MKYKDGQIFNNKRIIKFVCALGKNEFYRVECLKCGAISTQNVKYLRSKIVYCKLCLTKRRNKKGFTQRNVSLD